VEPVIQLKKAIISTLFWLVLLISCFSIPLNANLNTEAVVTVQVGDIETFEYGELTINRKHELLWDWVGTENGTEVDIPFYKGDRYSIEITALNWTLITSQGPKNVLGEPPIVYGRYIAKNYT
jgi:hypothetical protein